MYSKQTILVMDLFEKKTKLSDNPSYYCIMLLTFCEYLRREHYLSKYFTVILFFRRMSRSEETRLCLRRGHKSSAATVTLLAVSFYLIFTTLPVTVCYVLQLIFVQGPTDITLEEMALHPTWQRHFRFFAIRKIIEEIGMSHYACNFFIYVLTGKLFRLEMRLLSYSLFCKDKMRRWRSQQYNGFNAPSSKLPLPPTLGVIAPPSENNVAPATLTSEEAQPHDSFLPSNHNGNGNGVAI